MKIPEPSDVDTHRSYDPVPRSLAAKEQACCAFFDFTVAARGDEIWWDATTVDDPIAQQILDELYRTVGGGVAALFERFDAQGLEIVTNDNGIMRPATPEELGIDGTC